MTATAAELATAVRGRVRTTLHLLALATYRRLPTRPRRWIVRVLAPSYTVGAICVIERDDGRILLVRQAYRARWGLPGGLLERGESAEDGARREVLEEVGLRVALIGGAVPVLDPRPQRIDLVFRAALVDPGTAADARPTSPEIREVAWHAPDALPPLQHETAVALTTLGFPDPLGA